jgi:hypothetical protein
VLSKLRHYREPPQTALSDLRACINPWPLLRSQGWCPASVQAQGVGTLSATFSVQSAQGARFLKTHLLPSGRDRLLREARLLSALYGESLSVAVLHDPDSSAGRVWLAMTHLDTCSDAPGPRDVRDTLAALDLQAAGHVISGCSSDQHPQGDLSDGFTALLMMARSSAALMSEHGLLSLEALVCVDGALERLERCDPGLERVACHGDLGPANIMRAGSSWVLIDWEDAFIGVRHYDYLYWLSFFSNRSSYAERPLHQIDLDRDIARDLLVMIVLLKCELAWRSGVWKHHALSFSDRILEMLELH